MRTIIKTLLSVVFALALPIAGLSLTVLSMSACGEVEEVVNYCNEFCSLTKKCSSEDDLGKYDLCIMDCELFDADGLKNGLNQDLIDCAKTDNCTAFMNCVEENK